MRQGAVLGVHERDVAVQAKLSPANFAELKIVTRALEGGSATAQEYHDRVVCLGLAADVVQLMSTCPVPAARDAVLAVHADYINSGTRLVGCYCDLCGGGSACKQSLCMGSCAGIAELCQEGQTTSECVTTACGCRYARGRCSMGTPGGRSGCCTGRGWPCRVDLLCL